jgi:diguanylate cyclase (GGDEF)-like protein
MNLEQFDDAALWPTIFDAVNFGLVLVDADARVLLWNGWLARHSGVDAEAARGQSLAALWGDDLAPSFVTALNNALRYRLPVVLSHVLHRSPLPLYAQWPADTEGERMPHAVTLTPLVVGHHGPCCLIQVTDSSRSISREKVLQKNSERLSQEVMTDGLTRAFSRGFFDQFFKQEFARAARQHTKLSLILLDVDFFKNYNDEYGHPAGDKALIAVVQAVNGALLRATDKLFRYGGEEFVVVLPDCTQEKAMAIAEQLRLAVLRLELSHRMSRVAHQLTVSLGVSTMLSSQTCSAEKLLEAADLALYAAKKQGRNCVRYCSPDLTQIPETA